MKLVIKKFPLIRRNSYEKKGYTSLCSYEENHFLRRRLFKEVNTKKRIIRSFKKDWFCKACLNVFSLKPLKKYKTLLQFPLECPKCKSEKVAHNHHLINAIINKKPADELSKYYEENNVEVDLVIENINKYYLELLSNDDQKSSPDFIISLY